MSAESFEDALDSFVAMLPDTANAVERRARTQLIAEIRRLVTSISATDDLLDEATKSIEALRQEIVEFAEAQGKINLGILSRLSKLEGDGR